MENEEKKDIRKECVCKFEKLNCACYNKNNGNCKGLHDCDFKGGVCPFYKDKSEWLAQRKIIDAIWGGYYDNKDKKEDI